MMWHLILNIKKKKLEKKLKEALKNQRTPPPSFSFVFFYTHKEEVTKV